MTDFSSSSATPKINRASSSTDWTGSSTGPAPADHSAWSPLSRRENTLRTLAAILHTRSLMIGLVIVVPTVIVGVFANHLTPYDPTQINATELLQAPSFEHWLGTDALGHDTFSQIIVGSQISLEVGFLSVLGGMLVGIALGMLSGYTGGRVDDGIMWLMDALLVFPGLVLALTITTFLGVSLWNIIFALMITLLPAMTRLVRGQVMSIQQCEFVLAAHAVGVPHVRVMVRHILPNLLGLVIVQGAISTGSAIITEASLSFLGMGVPPPTPSWGRMLQDGYSFLLINPWVSVAPGAAIFIVVFGLSMLADGFRDFLHRADAY